MTDACEPVHDHTRWRAYLTTGMLTPSTLTIRECSVLGTNLDIKCIDSVLEALTSHMFLVDRKTIMSVMQALIRQTAIFLYGT